MHFDKLKKGYRIEYTFIRDEKLQYANTPVYNKRELNERLTELHKDDSVQKAIVMDVRYFDKNE